MSPRRRTPRRTERARPGFWRAPGRRAVGLAGGAACTAVAVAVVAAGGPAVGAGGPTVAGPRLRPAADTQPSYVLAAEQVVGPFIAGYESYSYDDAPTATSQRVAPYVSGPLGAALATPSQGGAGATLSAEKVVGSATVGSLYVESASPDRVSLLVTAVIHTTSSNGGSVVERYVPVTLTATAAGWKVSDVDSLMESVVPGAPGTVAPAPVAPAPPAPARPQPPAPRPAPVGRPSGVPAHLGGIPDNYLSWYEEASTTCPGLSWSVLAAIGTVESDNGQSSLPGVHSGANYAGAEGPMQFLPSTFAAYGTVAPGGATPASPYDPPDAIWSAARLLCADGAARPGGLYGAVFAYNHSAAYVTDVLAIASRYASASGSGDQASTVGLGSVIVRDAESYLGTPYVWGGDAPGGFDCSGLVQWVFAQAGLSLPRVAQDQYDAGPHLPASAELYAGDLVFFGSGPRGVEHVGIYLGGGMMVDAPHTGAVVREEPVAGFNPPYVGATRPEIPDLSASGPGLPVVVAAAGPRGGPHRAAGDGHEGTRPGPAAGATPSGRHHRPTDGTWVPTTDTPGTTWHPGDPLASADGSPHHRYHHHREGDGDPPAGGDAWWSGSPAPSSADPTGPTTPTTGPTTITTAPAPTTTAAPTVSATEAEGPTTTTTWRRAHPTGTTSPTRTTTEGTDPVRHRTRPPATAPEGAPGPPWSTTTADPGYTRYQGTTGGHRDGGGGHRPEYPGGAVYPGGIRHPGGDSYSGSRSSRQVGSRG